MLRFLTYESRDVDERRRGTLFQYFLAGIVIPVLGLLGINLYELATQTDPDALLFVVTDVASLGFLVVLWFVHRRFPNVARHLFLLMLALAPVSLFEIQVLDRVLVTLTIPVMMAAFLIGPVHSFVYAVVVSAVYSAVILQSFSAGVWGDNTLSYAFNYPSLLSTLVIAFIAWLISRSLEQALAQVQQRAEELRILNEELDQRVRERTRELAEALGRESATAARNQAILESIGDGVLVIDNDNRIIISNPAARRLTRQEMTGKPLHEVLAGVEPAALANIEEYIVENEVEERPIIQFELNRLTVAANITPISLGELNQGQMSGSNVMVLRDVTREAELDKMKTIFLGTVSHELRTPMAAIKGFVDVLADQEAGNLSESGREYLGVIDSNVSRLLVLANDLIDMSRLEVGEIALYCEWTDLEPIIRDAVDTVRHEFEKRGLSLTVQIEPDLPSLYLDQNRIVQVLLNLLTNVYKYTVEGGATVNARRSREAVQIEISDTGVGVTEAEQARIFERFFRSERRVVQEAGGSGLGLAISRGLVELHGGTITFHSEQNAGTTFFINLPLAEAP
ncbi:MAG: sensor histidine kinase [Anaerolineae bacterium]